MAKNTPDLTAMLRPRDRNMLDEAAGINWIPKDPRELLLPYVDASDDSELDKNSLEYRRRKAKDVYDGYSKIIENCKELEGEIEQQCKNVKVSLDPSRSLRVIEAVKRVFGTNGQEITFEMYKACVKALGEISGQNIPAPTDKDKQR